MKKSATVLTLLILTLALWAGNGFAYTINDDTDVQEGRASSTDTGFWVDVVGSPSLFDVYGIDVTWLPDTITFDLYTNFGGFEQVGDAKVYLSDLALDLNKDGFYEYGIVLDDQNPLSLGVGLYKETSWYTSSFYIEPLSSSYWYGEQWDDHGTAGANPRDPYVTIDSGTKVSDLDPVSPSLSNIGSNPSYQLSFTIATSDLIGLGSSIDVFWGNATCANDVIAGTVSPVPEPATMLLFGSGLLAMVGLGRKRLLER